MTKVLYAGDYVIIHHTYLKGKNAFTFGEVFDERRFLLDPLKKYGDIEVDYLPTMLVSEQFPSTPEEISKYDVIIISDVGTDTLLLYPDMFKIPMGPNRLNLIEQYVKQGGGFVLVGGWMAFGGQMGQGKYHKTIIEDVLNINVSPYDDRVEVPEGFKFNITQPNHPLNRDMDWDNAPLLFLGYNRFEARDKEGIIAEWNGDPMMVANQYGKGRALAFASDLAPHWAQGFVNWEEYGKFWNTCIQWLAKK
jgi:uncharacterized membrane protein